MQDKLDEFKSFIKDKPFLAKEVKEGKISWQTLYETYDLFGKDHEFFKEPEIKEDSKATSTTETDSSSSSDKTDDSSSKSDQIGKIIKSLQKVDTKKISDGLDNVKKIVGLIDELRPTGASRIPSMRIKPFRRYND